MEDRFSWCQMPGPSRMIDKLTDYLLNSKPVWMFSGKVTWDYECRNEMRNCVMERDSTRAIELIDASGTDSGHVIETVLSYASTSAIYYPSQSFGDFVVKNKIGEGYILWVYNLDNETEDEWLNVSRQLAAKKAGLVVCCECTKMHPPVKNIEMFNCDSFISEFDVLHYVMASIVNLNKGSSIYKTYISSLVSEVAGMDIEKCQILLENIDDFETSPIEKYNELFYDSDVVDIKKRVWNAQIKTLYPVIEQRRIEFVARNIGKLRGLVPFTNEWGSEVTEPEEMELGNIIHFRALKEIELSPEENACLNNLYGMRNILSHLNVVEGDMLKEFLQS